MRKILYMLLVTAFSAGSYSCEQDLMGYEGEEGIYFAVQWGSSWGSDANWPYMPYSNVELFSASTDETVKNLRVMVTGPIKDYDRAFQVEIVKESTTAPAESYELVATDFVIPAGDYRTNVQVKVRKNSIFEQEVKTVTIRLIPGKDLALSFPEWDAVAGMTTGTVVEHFDAGYHTLNISDFMVEPSVWPGSVNADTGADQGMWGGFTRKKLELFCELFDLTYQDFMSSTTMPSGLQNLIVEETAAYLVEMYDAGTPILEEDGRLMCMWYVPWQSYVGVPWVPGT